MSILIINYLMIIIKFKSKFIKLYNNHYMSEDTVDDTVEKWTTIFPD